MDLVELAKLTSALPLTVLLVLVLVGGYVEWWIYGSIHRKTVEELNKQLALERGRADRWETRFLELNAKIDLTLDKANEIGHAVDGTATHAADRLTALEAKISTLHAEITRVQALRVSDAQGKL
jgi:hypothetical protein